MKSFKQYLAEAVKDEVYPKILKAPHGAKITFFGEKSTSDDKKMVFYKMDYFESLIANDEKQYFGAMDPANNDPHAYIGLSKKKKLDWSHQYRWGGTILPRSPSSSRPNACTLRYIDKVKIGK